MKRTIIDVKPDYVILNRTRMKMQDEIQLFAVNRHANIVEIETSGHKTPEACYKSWYNRLLDSDYADQVHLRLSNARVWMVKNGYEYF